MAVRPPSLMRTARPGDFGVWCLALGCTALALAASAQTPPAGPNPDLTAPIAVPPDVQSPPPTAAPAPPAAETWDRASGFQKLPDDEWTRHFRVGAMVGMNISASFNLKNNLTLSGKNAAAGTYDDGYVHPSGGGPYTSDWGYDQDSQYNATTHRLTMHQTTSFTPDSGASTEESGDVFPGFDLAYGGNFLAWRDVRIGWEFGFGLLPIDISGNLSSAGTVNQDLYAFDTSGIDSLVPFPPAGYHGGPGGTLSLPSDPVGTGTDTADGRITGSRTLDVILYTFRLGPTLYWDLNQRLGLTLGGGPALGLVSGHLDYDETITTATTTTRNKGRIDGTDVVYGGYVNATLTYHVEDNGDFYLGFQYMPLGDATISGDGREGKLNLGGQMYITAGINWPF
jgi:hypothetical protein